MWHNNPVRTKAFSGVLNSNPQVSKLGCMYGQYDSTPAVTGLTTKIPSYLTVVTGYTD